MDGLSITPRGLNKKNVRKLITTLTDRTIHPEVGFNMDSWFSKISEYDDVVDKRGVDNCGTLACIGGWVNILQAEEEKGRTITNIESSNISYKENSAAGWLGLTKEEGQYLFYPTSIIYDVDYSTINFYGAVNMLTDLVSHGTASWDDYVDGDNEEA